MKDKMYKLNNGKKIPIIGFGTWMIENDKVAECVREAIEIGYRHIDTAQAYENEIGVGEGIRTSNINREELFVTTKIAAEIKDYEQAIKSIDESLERLNIGYIDLIIIHSPKPWSDFLNDNHYFDENLEVWKALEEAVNTGKVRSIGVSNFEKIDLENILNNGKIKPAVNQILAHIGNMPFELIDYSQKNGILVEAYSPFGHGEMLKNKMIKSIADKYNVSTSQLAINYLVKQKLLPLPKSTNPIHMIDNLDMDFAIQEEDIKALDEIQERNYGVFKDFPVFAK